MHVFHCYFITRNGCGFKHYAYVNLLEEKIHSSHTKCCLFFFLSRYLPLWPSPSVLVKVHFSLVAEVKDPIPVIARDWLSSLWLTCTTQKKDFERSHHQMTAETFMFQREHSTVPRGRTEWDLATSGDWLAINNAMGTLTIQLMLSRAFHTCFHEITAWTLRCLVGSDGRTAGTAEQQLYFFFLCSLLLEQRTILTQCHRKFRRLCTEL